MNYFIEETWSTGNGALAIYKTSSEYVGYRNPRYLNRGNCILPNDENPVKAIWGANNYFVEIWGSKLERDNFQIYN